MQPGLSYVLVHSRWDEQTRRVPLPAMVGSDPACDIVVNADAVAAHAYAIYEHDRQIEVRQHESGQIVPPETLERYGIQISKPLVALDSALSPRSKRSEWVAKESIWFARLPFWLRVPLGSPLPQFLRFGLWSLLLTLLVAWTFIPDETIHVDYSNRPIALRMDHVSPEIIGVTIKRAGYEKGALLTVEATKEQASQALLLSFRAAKLDLGNELRVLIGESVVYESPAMPNCIKQFCDIKVRIAAGLLQEGLNEIRMIHDPRGGYYIIGDILVRPLPPIKPEEVHRVERWKQVATRAYNERDIVPENLVRVRQELGQALAFLNTRDGAAPLRARIEAFLAEAEEAFEAEVKDRWAKVEINRKLKNYDAALFHLDRLRGLFPDTASKQHQNVQNSMRQIKEMRK